MLKYFKLRSESDYESIRDIVRHNCSVSGHLHPQLHIGNLDFERYAFRNSDDDFYDNAWLIEDDTSNKIIGFIITEEEEFFFSLLTEHRHHMEAVMEYVENCIYGTGEKVVFDINTNNTDMAKLLKRRGYKQTDFYRYSGLCDLSLIHSEYRLPEGYSIRNTTLNDVKSRVKLFSLATGGVETTEEKYRGLMSSPSYQDSLDLVVETSEREIIAYCTIWNDPVSRIAILEPLACAEAHRRKGIMKALLLYGMNKVKDSGTKYVYVGTGGTNTKSQALYKSVGFMAYGWNYEWEKTKV